MGYLKGNSSSLLFSRLISALLILGVSACSPETFFSHRMRTTPISVFELTANTLTSRAEGLDCKILIDNSGSMAAVQASLTTGLAGMLDQLTKETPGFPPLRLNFNVLYSDDQLRHSDWPGGNPSTLEYRNFNPHISDERNAFLSATTGHTTGSGRELYFKPLLWALNHGKMTLSSNPRDELCFIFVGDEYSQDPVLTPTGEVANPAETFANNQLRYTTLPGHTFFQWGDPSIAIPYLIEQRPIYQRENGGEYAEKLIDTIVNLTGRRRDQVAKNMIPLFISTQIHSTMTSFIANNRSHYAAADQFEVMANHLKNTYQNERILKDDVLSGAFGDKLARITEIVTSIRRQYTLTLPQAADPSSISGVFVGGGKTIPIDPGKWTLHEGNTVIALDQPYVDAIVAEIQGQAAGEQAVSVQANFSWIPATQFE